MKKMLFVMNPYSGMRRASKYLADIIALFNEADYEVIAHMTRGQGDAIQIVKNRAKDMDLIVCCGGDGTFNETVTGILEAGADVPVGYIPAGSTYSWTFLDSDPKAVSTILFEFVLTDDGGNKM